VGRDFGPSSLLPAIYLDPDLPVPVTPSDLAAYSTLQRALSLFPNVYPKGNPDSIWFHIVKALCIEFGMISGDYIVSDLDRLIAATFVDTGGPMALRYMASNFGIAGSDIFSNQSAIWRLAIKNFGVSQKVVPNAFRRVLMDFLCKQLSDGSGGDIASEEAEAESEILFEDNFDGDEIDADQWTVTTTAGNEVNVTGGNAILLANASADPFVSDVAEITRKGTLPEGDFQVVVKVSASIGAGETGHGVIGAAVIAFMEPGTSPIRTHLVGFVRLGAMDPILAHVVSVTGSPIEIVGFYELPEGSSEWEATLRITRDGSTLYDDVDFGAGWHRFNSIDFPSSELELMSFLCTSFDHPVEVAIDYWIEQTFSTAVVVSDYCDCFWKSELATKLYVESTDSDDDFRVEIWGVKKPRIGNGENDQDAFWRQFPVIDTLDISGTTPVATFHEFVALTGIRKVHGSKSGAIIIRDENGIQIASLPNATDRCGWFYDEPCFLDDIYTGDLLAGYETGDYIEAPDYLPAENRNFSTIKQDYTSHYQVVASEHDVGGRGILINNIWDDDLLALASGFNLPEPLTYPGDVVLRFQITVQKAANFEVLFVQTIDDFASYLVGGIVLTEAGKVAYRLPDGSTEDILYDTGLPVSYDLNKRTLFEVEYSMPEGMIRRLHIDGREVARYMPSLGRFDGASESEEFTKNNSIQVIAFHPKAMDDGAAEGEWLVENIQVGGCSGNVRIMAANALRVGAPSNAAYLHENEDDTSWHGPCAGESTATRMIDGNGVATGFFGFFLGGLSSNYMTTIRGSEKYIKAAGIKIYAGPGDLQEYL
jgi:hypothetical protein